MASTTVMKSYVHWPTNAPHFISRGKGGIVWDVDGNEFVDLVGALLPNVLGYCDVDVDNAIRDQLEKGIIFSLPSDLETILAERLVELIPCAEMVKFGKSGSDATGAAIRLARAYTAREHVITCGYFHGWQDWFIGHSGLVDYRLGVPQSVRALTHPVRYGDLEDVEEVFRNYEVAAVILEPARVESPPVGYLAALKEMCSREGTLLVFDEVITGFRWAIGGAQQYYGVTPDLSCFGKAMANGMPVSALVGKRDAMQFFDRVFYSGTFSGEGLSLAAAIATINKIERFRVCEALWEMSYRLHDQVNEEISRNSLEEQIWLGPRELAIFTTINFANDPTRNAFISAMAEKGVLVHSSHNLCFAHSAHLSRIMEAWCSALSAIKNRN